jgi:hypothetical protein
VSGGSWDTSIANYSSEFFRLKPTGSAGTVYTVSVTVSGKNLVNGANITKTAETKVRVVTAAPAQASEAATAGFSFPLKNFSPGQFTEAGTGHGWSLGAWGGYVTFKYRALKNGTNYSFAVTGNPMNSWSEPGIVSVMRDENGNGLPDDTWYELKGSADTQDPSHITRRYAVTYIKSADHGTTNEYGQIVKRVYWYDAKGRAGIFRGGWPVEWGVTGDWVSYSGTLLDDYGLIATAQVQPKTTFWWGYVDNWGWLETGDWWDCFRISDAIQPDGSPANLPWIDFIKVHTGVFIYGSVFGEISTEIVALRTDTGPHEPTGQPPSAIPEM